MIETQELVKAFFENALRLEDLGHLVIPTDKSLIDEAAQNIRLSFKKFVDQYEHVD